MTNRGTSVVVVGGGIVGAACAWALAEDGWSVTLLEAGRLAGGTTSAGMGHIVTLDSSAAILSLTRYSIDAWNALASEIPTEVRLNRCGTIWLAKGGEEAERLEHRAVRLRASGCPVDILDSSEVRTLEPHVEGADGGGMWVKDDAILDAPAATRYFARQAERRGARVVENASVAALDGTRAVMANGDVFAGERVVLASGTRAPELVPGLPIQGRKGHLLQLRPPTPMLHHHLTDAGYGKAGSLQASISAVFTAQPLPDGTLLLGASRQNGVTSPDVDPRVLELLYERASPFFPAVRSFGRVDTRTGFRPATPDDLPLIGNAPGHDTLMLAVGHEGFGVTTSVGTAFLVRDLLANRRPGIPVDPYVPDRFSAP